MNDYEWLEKDIQHLHEIYLDKRTEIEELIDFLRFAMRDHDGQDWQQMEEICSNLALCFEDFRLIEDELREKNDGD